MLNLLHLKTYLNLVEIQSYTQTAKKLNMTQPGVSQHVRWLEEYFGEKLVHTAGKKIEITPKGHDVYQYALKIFSEHEEFRKSLQVDDPKAGFCRLASPGGIGIGLYTELLKINREHPKLAIQFHYAPNKSIEADLLENKLDLGFMSIPSSNPLLEATKVGEEKLFIIMPRNAKVKTIEDLLELGFINHPDGRAMLEKAFALNFPTYKFNFDEMKISGGNNQIGRILEPVSLGLGFTILSQFAYEAFEKKNRLSLFPLKKLVANTLYVVSKKNKTLPARFPYLLKLLMMRNLFSPER